MDVQELPEDAVALKALLLRAQRELEISKQQVVELSSTVSDQQKQLAAKEQKILELLKALRGKQRERIDPDQLFLFDLGELEQIIEEQLDASRPAACRRRKKHGRRLIPDVLPAGWLHEVVEHTLPEDQRRCPVDGQVMVPIRVETSKQLDYVPGRFKVIEHRRSVYACSDKHDEALMPTAPKPPQPIEKGMAAPGLLAQVVVSKFGDHLPGYRQEVIFSRHGIEIRRSTIYDWMAAAADLCQPLYELMKQQVLQSQVIHTDDTQVKLIDHSIRSTRSARFWGYLGDANHRYVIYDFTEDRTRDGPVRFLAGFRGYLQTTSKKTATARPAKTFKAKPEPKPKRVSALDAAAEVLASAKEPMNCQALIEEMATKSLWTSPRGKTPHATLYAAILREMNTKGNEARFKKVDRGQFAAS